MTPVTCQHRSGDYHAGTMSQGLIAQGTPEYRRLALAMLMAGLATFSLLYNVQPLLPIFASEFGLPAAQASLALSIATAPLAIGILVAGGISDAIGRRGLIAASLIIATLCSLATPLAPTWSTLLVLRFLCGVALSGVPAVAITYLSEEVERNAIAPVVGLYISGTAIGGMLGRVCSATLVEWLPWRVTLAIVACLCAVATLLFVINAPASKGFRRKAFSLAAVAAGYAKALSDWVLLLLYACAFLLMGAFVTLYNYIPFRLTQEPYSVSFVVIGAISLFYTFGSISSSYFGKISVARGLRFTFWIPVTVFLAGIGLTMLSPLWIIVPGIAIVTIGFFGAHSLASSWVAKRAFDRRAHASALYLFFYYLGSSTAGSAGGLFWAHSKWMGVALFCAALCLAALAGAWTLRRSTPRDEPASESASEPAATLPA